jgi:hypothetical protein
MATPNFQSILDESPTEVNVPPPLPVGTYSAIVIGTPEYGESAQKQTPFVEFTYKLTSAGPDVDEDELDTCGGLDGRTLKNKYWLTPDAAFMLDQFHEHCGLDLGDAESRRNRNDLVINSEVKVHVKHRTSPDGSRIYLEIDRTLPAD